MKGHQGKAALNEKEVLSMWHGVQLWDFFLLVAVDVKNTNYLKQQQMKLQEEA